MARVKIPLAVAAVATVVAVHAVLLPLLYYAVMYAVERSHSAAFVEHARTVSRTLADAFEVADVIDDPARRAELLDSAILNGEGVFAEVVLDGKHHPSTLNRPGMTLQHASNFRFGGHPDHVYVVSIPLDTGMRQAELRIGFDELLAENEIAAMRATMVQFLFAYAAVSLALSAVIAWLVVRPVRELQLAARQITTGGSGVRLATATRFREIAELANDLEQMRVSLVGLAARLRSEIRERTASERDRVRLESLLRQRQRLETVGTLAGGVAHEFNNVLVPITLYTEVALGDLEPADPVRGDLERVLQAARRARELVRKVLTFSRQLGDERRELLDVRASVEETLTLFTALAPPNVELTVEFAPAPRVMANGTLMAQLLMNLCTNAWQAMHPVGGTLTIGVRSRQLSAGEVGALPPGDYAEIYVADTGHGMDETTADRVFEPFFTTRGVGEGTGLGLAVVHGIVTSFGGSIALDTAPGRGTRFTVLLPGQPETSAPASPDTDSELDTSAQVAASE